MKIGSDHGVSRWWRINSRRNCKNQSESIQATNCNFVFYPSISTINTEESTDSITADGSSVELLDVTGIANRKHRLYCDLILYSVLTYFRCYTIIISCALWCEFFRMRTFQAGGMFRNHHTFNIISGMTSERLIDTELSLFKHACDHQAFVQNVHACISF